MATVYTLRVITVVRAARGTQGRTATATVDTVGGDRTFDVPLRNAGDATNTVRGHWCNWAMTPTERSALTTAFRAQGFTTQECNTLGSGATPTLSRNLFIFDATFWTPQQVLTALGFDTLASTLL